MFNPHVNIIAHHGNIKSHEFGSDYFKKFTLVMNALDNLGLSPSPSIPSSPAPSLFHLSYIDCYAAAEIHNGYERDIKYMIKQWHKRYSKLGTDIH